MSLGMVTGSIRLVTGVTQGGDWITLVGSLVHFGYISDLVEVGHCATLGWSLSNWGFHLVWLLGITQVGYRFTQVC